MRLWKRDYRDRSVHITPKYQDATGRCRCGCRYDCLGCYPRKRPDDENLATIIDRIHQKPVN
ncbi:MAG UNVERIFIED_CONTAM: hypothetical protein LVR29_23340 [Microcystis novacekii LVE1205-3]